MARTFVFSGDSLIRFSNGRILVHTTSSRLPAFETDQSMLIGWVARFKVPSDVEAAIAELPQGDRQMAAQVVNYLIRSGVLVEAGTADAADRTPSDSAVLIRNHLRLLARSVYDLACDVLGLGPEVSEKALAQQTGIGLERRLIAALASLDLNVLWGLPFPDRSASHVFVSHMLEHLFFPRDVRFFLAELRRVMSPGGVVRIVVPDIEQCIEAYTSNDRQFFTSRRETWDWWPENATRLEDFLAYSGAGAEPAYLFEAHKYGYDFETLVKALGEAGFERVRRSAYMASDDPALRVDNVSTVAKARHGDRYYSLFVEANAPAGARIYFLYIR